MSNCIYFIRPKTLKPEPILIGWCRSSNVSAKLDEIQAAHWLGLEVSATIEFGDLRETMLAEGSLHERFADHRILGRWYSPVAEILEMIETGSVGDAIKKQVKLSPYSAVPKRLTGDYIRNKCIAAGITQVLTRPDAVGTYHVRGEQLWFAHNGRGPVDAGFVSLCDWDQLAKTIDAPDLRRGRRRELCRLFGLCK